MKKIALIAIALALPMAFACITPKETIETVKPVEIESTTLNPESPDGTSAGVIDSSNLVENPDITANSPDYIDTPDTTTNFQDPIDSSSTPNPTQPTPSYDIIIPFDDPVFCQIIEGKIVPTEVTHAVGGEGGYNGEKSNDPAIIQGYIEAFRNMKIKEIVTDENDFTLICDGVNDYIFGLDDGTEVLISLDLSTYVIKDGKQYVFEYSEELHEMNKKLGNW